MRHHALRMGSRPRREGVSREAIVHDRKVGLEVGRLKVLEIVPQLTAREHALEKIIFIENRNPKRAGSP